jgi:hypothetical protein
MPLGDTTKEGLTQKNVLPFANQYLGQQTIQIILEQITSAVFAFVERSKLPRYSV